MEHNQHNPQVLHPNSKERVALIEQLELIMDLALEKWWFVLIFTLIGTIYMSYQTYREPDVFQATGSLMAVPKLNVAIGTVYKDEMDNFFGTQIQLLKSTKISSIVE